MYIIGEPGYSTTNWYRQILSPLKAQARRKHIQLYELDSAEGIGGESCAFMMGGNASWIADTVRALLERGCHPIILNELPAEPLFGRYSCVKTDYHRFTSILRSCFENEGRVRTAFYGMNPRSLSDMARKNAFSPCFPNGRIIENRGSLSECFGEFLRRHQAEPFDSVICANDFAAVSLRNRLRAEGMEKQIRIAVHSNTHILGYFPEVLTVSVDNGALAIAAFEIADCIAAHPELIGMSVTVDYLVGQGIPGGMMSPDEADGAYLPSDGGLYLDPELGELMRIEQLLSECDGTDLKIITLLEDNGADIGEEAYLSDNGVKYRIRKMKRLLGVESRRDIPALLKKHGIALEKRA